MWFYTEESINDLNCGYIPVKFSLSRRLYAGLITVVCVSAIILGVILSFHPSTNYLTQEIQVGFHPKNIRSCPGHTVWLLVSITGVKDPVEALSISIQTNQSIQTDYVLWPDSSPQVLEVFLYPNSFCSTSWQQVPHFIQLYFKFIYF